MSAAVCRRGPAGLPAEPRRGAGGVEGAGPSGDRDPLRRVVTEVAARAGGLFCRLLRIFADLLGGLFDL